MKLIIAGSRDFKDYDFLEQRVLSFIKRHRVDKEPVEIVSGGARGADRLGEKFAKKFSLVVHRMPAEWDKHGRAAGHIRNGEMAEIATHCIVFWDGRSRGTQDMRLKAMTKKLVLEEVRIAPHEDLMRNWRK